VLSPRLSSSCALFCFQAILALSARSDFSVTLAAIHRSTFTGLERYFGFLTALGAYGREHLALGPVAAIPVTLCFPVFAALGTALGLISIAFRLEELLFLSAESEGSPTIGTLELLVLKAHWMTSSLLIVG